MRARLVATFVLGFAAGMICLAAVMWMGGRLPGVGAARPGPVAGVGAARPAPIAGAEVARPGPIAGVEVAPLPPAPDVKLPPPVMVESNPVMVESNNGAPHLAMPVQNVDPVKLTSAFNEIHSGHPHEALDIMAPRGTPVSAVAEGNVVKLFTSKEGGLTVYQFDNSRTWCFYYAHLDRYAPNLKAGMLLRTGDVLGYVGSTGNASADAPHLHFAVFRLGPEREWWKGTAIDPLPLLR